MGLRELSASLDSLIEFLGIDRDLIEVAASASAPLKAGASRKELAAWIRHLPKEDKNDLLVAAALDSGERWRTNFCAALRSKAPYHQLTMQRSGVRPKTFLQKLVFVPMSERGN
jgi:hypothetical protein